MNITKDYRIVKDESRLDEILKMTEKALVLVYATWCPFCMRFLPVFQRYAQGKDNYIFAEDNQEMIAEQYHVDIIPTVLFFEKGEVTLRLDGAPGMGLNEKQLLDFIEKIEKRVD